MLLIDNFDSFTYNLVQCFQILNIEPRVVRHNALSIEECDAFHPQYLVISPGPGTPSQAGISKDLILHFAGKIPILGVCLGHQCIGEVFGAKVVRAQQPMHGKTSEIFHTNHGIFQGLIQGFTATRYHSLLVERNSLPPCLKVTAETSTGEIMGLSHKTLPIEGVQFHPESILTNCGLQLLKNFINKIP